MAAAGDVSRQSHMKSPVDKLVDRRNTGGKVHIRFRRVGDIHASSEHQLLLGVVRVHTVRHDAGIPPAEHAELVIRIAIEFGPRAELLHPFDLAEVFRQMALHRQIVFCAQPGQCIHQVVGTRRNEAWGQNRLRMRKALARLHHPALCIADCLIGGDFAQIPRTVAVHVDLADIGAEPRVLQLLHQKQCRRKMQRRKNARARGRAAGKARNKALIRRLGIREVLIFGLFGEGVGVEPVEQLQIHPEPPEGKLRRVNVQVRHAGNDQLSRIIKNVQVREALGLAAEDACRPAVAAEQPPVVENFYGIGAAAV